MKIGLGIRTALPISFPVSTHAFTTPSKLSGILLKPSSSREVDWEWKVFYMTFLFFNSMQMHNPIRDIRQLMALEYHEKGNPEMQWLSRYSHPNEAAYDPNS